MYVLTLIMFVTITLLIYVLARFSPMQWEEPSNCIRDPTELTNQYNFLNSFWFILGAFMQQGSDVAPESLSVRCVVMGGYSSEKYLFLHYFCDNVIYQNSLYFLSFVPFCILSLKLQ